MTEETPLRRGRIAIVCASEASARYHQHMTDPAKENFHYFPGFTMLAGWRYQHAIVPEHVYRSYMERGKLEEFSKWLGEVVACRLDIGGKLINL